jgi:ABC-type hemin transport system ATPase subunit
MPNSGAKRLIVSCMCFCLFSADTLQLFLSKSYKFILILWRRNCAGVFITEKKSYFQDKNIYLLDDIMSAVDINVARHIFNNCINGLLRNRTRILCTHNIQYLLCADHILVMENGRIKQQGKYSASVCADA